MAGSDPRTNIDKQVLFSFPEPIWKSAFVPPNEDSLVDDPSPLLPGVRDIEGCPLADEHAFLALAAPPSYTPYPNPSISSFLSERRSGDNEAHSIPSAEAYGLDVAHVRAGPVYDAHSYPTKVPPEAIVPYILHYTKPDDCVLDVFAGTGMTGIAAQMCAHPPEELRAALKATRKETFWGLRRAALCDLSPLATFIGACLNMELDPDLFAREAHELIRTAESELGWVYETYHGNVSATVNYVIWSEVFVCPNCNGRIEFWSAAIDHNKGGIKRSFLCPQCSARLTKPDLTRLTETVFDQILRKPVERVVRVPTLVNYGLGRFRYERPPTEQDMELLGRVGEQPVPDTVPVYKMMCRDGSWGDLYRSGYHIGITHVHHFYFVRSLLVLATLWKMANQAPRDVARGLKFMISSYNITHSTLMTRMIYKKDDPKPVLTGYQTGALYIGSLPVEKNILLGLRQTKLPQIKKAFRYFRRSRGAVVISTQSAASLLLPPESIDYIFTDPPFGDNIQYSEGNFIAEAWLGCFTDRTSEAVISASQKKGPAEYRHLMTLSFRNAFLALKGGRWMTVVFHNSKNSVWNAIQEAITTAGFVVADVRTLDKKQGSFKQVTSAGAVKQDLVISAYKPNAGLEERFKLTAGTEEGAWDFVRTHLRQLPVFTAKEGRAEVIVERQNYLLFDRMVAFHVQRGVTVPLSAAEFYQGLAQRFSERDGMFFLPEQTAEYDKKRMTVREVMQLQLAVTDESSALQWLKRELGRKPQTFQELHPQFMKEIGGWDKHEKPLELSDLLEQNFLRYDGKGAAIPAQVVSWLKQSEEMRKIMQEEAEAARAREENGALHFDEVGGNAALLMARAKDRWYTPDPNKAGDLEKLRERALLKEFETYRTSGVKRLKVFRLEAVRAGFKKAWQERDYGTIVQVAGKIPDNVLQEDQKLLMWYDQALTRKGEE